MALRRLCWRRLLLLSILLIGGCAESSRKPFIGQQNLQFKQVFKAGAGQTISAVHSAISVGASTCTVFSYTDSGIRKLAWLMEAAPGAGAVGSGFLEGSFDFDQLDVQMANIGTRWILIAVRSGNVLQLQVVTILPSTLPQFLVSDWEVLTDGTAGAVGQYRLLAHQDVNTAWISWTEFPGGAAEVGEEVRLQIRRINNVTTGPPVIVSEYTSPLNTAAAPLMLDSISSWDGQLAGAWLDASTNAPAWILGRLDAGNGEPLATPAAVQWDGTGLTPPLSNSNLFAAPRPTESQFVGPPTIEPCPDRDAFEYRDRWVTSRRNSGRVSLVTITEHKYNCPEDPEALLFTGTSWVLGALGGSPRRYNTIPPVTLAEGGNRQRVFVAHPSVPGIDVLRTSNLTRLTRIDFDETRTPPGLVIDQLHGVGREEYERIRVLGHTADTIYIAEREVGDLVSQ